MYIHLKSEHTYVIIHTVHAYYIMTYLTLLFRSIEHETICPKEACPQGIQVWVVADSENGYFLDVDVYIG